MNIIDTILYGDEVGFLARSIPLYSRLSSDYGIYSTSREVDDNYRYGDDAITESDIGCGTMC